MPTTSKSKRPRKTISSRGLCRHSLAVILVTVNSIFSQTSCFQSSSLSLLTKSNQVVLSDEKTRNFVLESHSCHDNHNTEGEYKCSDNVGTPMKCTSVQQRIIQFPIGSLAGLTRTGWTVLLAMTLSLVVATGAPLQVSAMDDSLATIVALDSPPSSTISSEENNADDSPRAGMSARRYWSIMASNPQTDKDALEMKIRANEALLDHAVVTINTMYYDNSGGAYFTSRDFYNKWRTFRDEARQEQQRVSSVNTRTKATAPNLTTREGAVQGLKYLVSTLNDPYSKYLTREELWQELHSRNDGFLGIGALVEPPEGGEQFYKRSSAPTLARIVPDKQYELFRTTLSVYAHFDRNRRSEPQLSATRVQYLPVVTAVVPDSPAERAGVTVGDRIVAVGDYTFLGQSRGDITRNFQTRFASGQNYFGRSDVTFAKPVFRSLVENSQQEERETSIVSGPGREVVIGYRQTRVRLPTMSLEEEANNQQTASTTQPSQPQYQPHTSSTSYAIRYVSTTSNSVLLPSKSFPSVLTTPPPTKGGNSIVHWELISGESTQPSIFQRTRSLPEIGVSDAPFVDKQKVGYIRLTRFSRAATVGYIDAVQSLEQAGATAFIIDIRNNYGGVIQEAMLTASTLLRDPHAVLCYTMNSRGGFTPHDVEEYVVDKRYPGYLLSREPQWVTLNQVHQENPDMFEEDGIQWVPPSSFASLHEQITRRGIHRPSILSDDDERTVPPSTQWNTARNTNLLPNRNQQWLAQKNVVILVNEGTASAAEVFASSLHDNGRTLALIGSKTYGKGLIQHTFPMPDGGGLRLTVAEYLTPALHHVTNVGNARFDSVTGEQVGGGIRPDLQCDSRQGIPSNVGADLCVGMALDVLEGAPEDDNAKPEGRISAPQLNRHPRVPSQDLLQEKSLFASDGNGGGSSTFSASSSIGDEITERPVNAKSMGDEF